MMIYDVLSIDLDFILYPCIHNYSSLINGRFSREENWDKIKQITKINFDICQERVNFLKQILNRYKGQNIYNADNHSTILKVINNLPVNIVNIDHHHDIFYTGYHQKAIEIGSPSNCSNWVYRLFCNHQLNSYTWIKNDTSEPFKGKMDCPRLEIDFSNIDSFDLLSKSFDFIFIANSLHYCPIGEEQKLLEILKEHPYIWSIV